MPALGGLQAKLSGRFRGGAINIDTRIPKSEKLPEKTPI